jgi:hypothetical protein
VRRKRRLYVQCRKNPKHKQRQGYCTTATPALSDSLWPQHGLYEQEQRLCVHEQQRRRAGELHDRSIGQQLLEHRQQQEKAELGAVAAVSSSCQAVLAALRRFSPALLSPSFLSPLAALRARFSSAAVAGRGSADTKAAQTQAQLRLHEPAVAEERSV